MRWHADCRRRSIALAGRAGRTGPAAARAARSSSLWCSRRCIAYVDRPAELALERRPLQRGDRAALRKIARQTWRFFDELVGAGDHWLIPDNYQEDRARADRPPHLAHQHRPAAALDARRLRFRLRQRRRPGRPARADVRDAAALPRYRGHFYNWYDTRTLAPLPPAYISTVDSGNLAGYLLTLRAGLRDLAERTPVDRRRRFSQALRRSRRSGRGGSRPRGRHWRRRRAPSRRLRRELAAAARHARRARRARSPTGMALPAPLTERLVGDRRAVARDRGVAPARRLNRGRRPAMARGRLLARSRRVGDRRAAGRSAAPRAGAGRTSSATTAWPSRPPGSASRRSFAAARRVLDAGTDIRARAAVDRMRCSRRRVDRARRAARRRSPTTSSRRPSSASSSTPERQLFSIGFNVTEGRLDASYYDTLASEARLASFVAIATGKIPHEHWFKLGRSLTPAGTLARAAVVERVDVRVPDAAARHARLSGHAARRDLPRGHRAADGVRRARAACHGASPSPRTTRRISSGNYQYRAFGVPGLGLKRGLADDLVVAPYASLLAAPLAPRDVSAQPRAPARSRAWPAATASTRRSTTPPTGCRRITTAASSLRTYMAHHQGMSLVALDNALHDCTDAARASTPIRACRRPSCCCRSGIPHLVPLKNPPIEKAEHVPSSAAAGRRRASAATSRRTRSARGRHLLSNGSYAVMVTNAGGGYSRRQGLAMTRWREDVTTDAWGSFCYVRDLDTGDVWSTTYQPTRREPDEYEATFAPDRADLPPRRRQHRDPHRDRGLARRRCRAAPRVGHQPRHRARSSS